MSMRPGCSALPCGAMTEGPPRDRLRHRAAPALRARGRPRDGPRPRTSALPASPRSRGVPTRRCTAGGRGRCGSTRGWRPRDETNARFRYLLEHGQTGLSVAFDLPTQMGYDSDHPRAEGEVGRTGVAIDSVDDMRRLFEGIPLDRVSTSMTINATAPILLLLYELVAEEQGVGPSGSRAPCRTTSSRSTRRGGRTSTRRRPRCAWSRTCSPTAASASRAGTRSRSAGTTCARRARPRCRRSPSRSPTASPTCRRRSTPGCGSTTSRPGCRSSSPATCTSSRRSRSSARPGGCGPGS